MYFTSLVKAARAENSLMSVRRPGIILEKEQRLMQQILQEKYEDADPNRFQTSRAWKYVVTTYNRRRENPMR